MRTKIIVRMAIMAAAYAPPAAATPAPAPVSLQPQSLNGAGLYQARCGACHSLDANKFGPAHRGVFGRKAASAENYFYSPALAASGIVWSDKTLDLWLQGPQRLVKGTRMYPSFANPAERAAIIAYLKAASGK
jgi:cytochrome c